MKLNLLILIFTVNLTFIGVLFAQEVPPAGELVIQIEDNYDDYEFRMDLISLLCYNANTVYPNLHNISNEYNSAVYITNDYARFFMTGFWQPPLENDFGLGLYKVSIIKNQQLLKYFYIDYRTSDLIENFNSGTSLNGDIFLDYDKNTNKLYYDGTQNEFPFFTTIWDEKYWIIPTTAYFPNYWGKCLSLINDGYNHPKLIWGPHPSFTTTHFYIYRAIEEIPVDPKHITFSLWAITNASTYELTSYDFVIEVDPTHCAFYYVKAYNSSNSTLSSATNGVSTEGQYIPYKIAIDKPNENQPLGFGLDQNYPNPFNPITTIGYSIKAAGLVTLKVYDMLGTEVTTLVNERKESGSYLVTFNASDLPSGIYVYKLSADNFIAAKKLILLK